MATALPLIDVSCVRGHDAGAKRAAASAIDAAARELGFLAVVGHGVPDSLFAAAMDKAREFFALPETAKRACARPSREESRGYAAMGGEALGKSLGAAAAYDLKETFAIGPIDIYAPEELGEHAYPHYTPNVWPAELPRLRPVWEAYYREMQRLADDLLRLLAIALDQPESMLVAKTGRCYSNLRAQHYPPLAVPPRPGQLRAGAHTDYGAVTVLRGEAHADGLQVEVAPGEWRDIVFPEGAYVVNLGDQLAMWSNDRWRSTLHRVAVPEDAGTRGRGRLSLGFFHMPDAAATIECLPNCASPERPARYPPVSAGWHKRLKFAMANGLDDVVASAPESARRAVAAWR
jgi:isopenicillin N synthase-like dioxygenase